MEQLYHWPVPCTICESPVEYHCNTCGDVLCSKCRDNHLKSNATKNHDVVPYSQRTELRKRSLQCGDHLDQQCCFWCHTCNRGICGDCVTSATQRGHHFIKFDEKIEERKEDIEWQVDRYSQILSDWEKSLKEAEQITESYEKDMMQLDKKISNQADELCRQVREVEKGSRKQLQEMKDASISILHDQQKALADGVQRLKERIKEIEDTLRSRDSSIILRYSVVEENIPGTKPMINVLPAVPVFAPGSWNIQVLKDMLGSLSDERQESIRPLSMQRKEVTSLLPNPSVINIEYHDIPAIACVGPGQAWLKTDDRRLQLMNRKDKVKRTVKIDFTIHDMAVSSQGNILLPDRSNNRIWTMSVEGEIEFFFNTQWEPDGICCLPSGDIVVVFQNDVKVVQYSSSGAIIKELGSLLFHYPWYVAHSQVNQQLVVCDKSNPNYFNASGRIRVLDMNGKLQYTYTGSNTTTFTPMGVCTDMAGHVLITDKDNDRVHILDNAGNFIRYILTGEQGLTYPMTIDVDSDGYAWIGEWWTGRVNVVKYTEKM